MELAMMFPGFGEWVIILIIVVIIFGSTRIPKVGEALGKGIRNFKKGIKEGKTDEEEKEDKANNEPTNPKVDKP
jgi:sec-independent protein translocase protein TatA